MADLTPTEDLILDLLVARRRLGEWEWPLSSRFVRSIHSLMSKGYVNSRQGNVQYTYLVRLTDKAKDEFIIDSEYTPQGFKAHADHIASYMDATGFESNVGKVIRKKFGKDSR